MCHRPLHLEIYERDDQRKYFNAWIAGDKFTVFVSNGKVYAMGSNAHGELGNTTHPQGSYGKIFCVCVHVHACICVSLCVENWRAWPIHRDLTVKYSVCVHVYVCICVCLCGETLKHAQNLTVNHYTWMLCMYIHLCVCVWRSGEHWDFT
jgi:hypothetical protein